MLEERKDNFQEKIAYTKITYVIAKYSKVHKCWFHQYEYDEIEEAKDKLKFLNSLGKTCEYAMFERIKSETFTMLN